MSSAEESGTALRRMQSETALRRMQSLAAARGAVTPEAAQEFSRAARAGWARDPEEAHAAEFRFRTRALHAIARGALGGEDARRVCAALAALARDKSLADKRWFA